MQPLRIKRAGAALRNRLRTLLACGSCMLLPILTASCASAPAPAPTISPPQPQALLGPSDIGGANGMRIGPDGKLYVGAVLSQALFRVDLKTGAVETVAEGTDAGADDLDFLLDGSLVWAAHMDGALMIQSPDGQKRVLVSDMPGADAVAVRPTDGRLFVTQCFNADALWEVDPSGARAPKKLLSDLGCLNGFDFGPDGAIYGPSWFQNKIIRIDPETLKIQTIIAGLKTPAAAKFGLDGKLYVVTAGDGVLLQVDVKKKTSRKVVQLKSGLDNLLPLDADTMMVASLTDNSIVAVNIHSGAVRPVIEGHFTNPGGIAACKIGGVEKLLVADISTLKSVNVQNGAVTELGRSTANAKALIESPIVAATGRSIVMMSGFVGAVQWMDLQSGQVRGTVKGFKAPYGLAELDDGTIAVAEFAANRISRIDAKTETLLAPIVSDLKGPAGLQLLPDGQLLVSETGGGIVSIIDVKTGKRRVIAENLQLPEGMALLPDGTVAVAEVGAKRIVRIDYKGGAAPTILAADLPIGMPNNKSMPLPFIPTGLAVSGDALFFSSNLKRNIYRIPLPAPGGANAAALGGCVID